jgi:hypothetical protein
MLSGCGFLSKGIRINISFLNNITGSLILNVAGRRVEIFLNDQRIIYKLLTVNGELNELSYYGKYIFFFFFIKY